MIKRAFILIFTLYSVSILLNSCGCPPYIDYYLWKDFRIGIIDNSAVFGQETTFLDVDNPIVKATLGFRIFAFFEVFRRPKTHRFNIISEAQALSCIFPEERLHSITSIVIKAISDDSVEINVTSSFRGKLLDNWRRREVSIDELIYQFNTSTSHLGFNRGNGNNFDLYLRDNSIDIRGKQRFEITITFDDGIVLVQETEELILV